MSVKEDSTLFSINLEQEKEVVIHYDIVLDEGEYQLVYISPDGTEQILHDGKIIQSEEKILFTQGQNEISILSNNAVFKEIDISIIGIQVSVLQHQTKIRGHKQQNINYLIGSDYLNRQSAAFFIYRNQQHSTINREILRHNRLLEQAKEITED
ncbi:hypothetical protein AALA90_03805 [Lachnospiraceae bacterium 38-10]